MQTIKCEDFLNYRFFSALEMAPDGRSAVFCLSQAVKEKNGYDSALWRYTRDDNGIAPIGGTESARSFCYLDPDRILFPTPGDKQDRDYVGRGGWLTIFAEKNLKTQECREAFRVPLKGATARLVHPNLFLLSCVRDNARPNIEAMAEEERNAALEKWKEEEDFEICDELPFLSDGRGFINKKRHTLYLYDTQKQELSELTERDFEAAHCALSAEGRYIAFSGVSYDRYYVRQHGIYLYDTETRKTSTLLTPGSYQIMGLDFLGEELVVAASPWNGEGPFPNHNLYTLPLTGGAMRLRHTHSREDFGSKTCSDCRYGAGTTFRVSDGYLYYFTTCDTAAYINRWKPGQQPERLNGEEFIPDSLAVGSGTLLATGTADGLQELFSMEDDGPRRISEVNAEALKDKAVSRPRKYQFRDRDNFLVSGFVIEPVGYDPKKTYPGILEIHGGPRAAFTAGFFHEMQYLAGKGYFVFFCNPRGSAGNGEAFADIRGHRGSADFMDVMEWTDFVLEQYPAIDPERLGVMGGSYGGYLTNWCITHTRRFHAAVSMRSISNITGDFGATDFGVWGTPGVYGGTPWNHEERLREQSPYTYAMNVTTPTLFLHSFEDFRCSLSGAMQMYSALQIKGVPTRMCLFRRSSHELSRSGAPRSRIRRLKELSGWVDRYLTEE
ncbi:S9 family peptidase [Oscillibacter sp. MSJ-2]|uniref:S9 family peptidase n=1 Tax=Dysosmobacter acutus TaxID=2841504 RepID=A0ABS6F8J3_9FIRM|nr:S9 family peptidase [Dysosmobacter acutus]MBU5626487.1 S9 family peptidase [Dysosmobacter acutus]